jgi:hypothetical protein
MSPVYQAWVLVPLLTSSIAPTQVEAKAGIDDIEHLHESVFDENNVNLLADHDACDLMKSALRTIQDCVDIQIKKSEQPSPNSIAAVTNFTTTTRSTSRSSTGYEAKHWWNWEGARAVIRTQQRT